MSQPVNDHQPTDDRHVPAAEVHVYPIGEGWWSWRYVERASGVELQSNDIYESREEAVESAGKAYPDLEVSEEEAGEIRETPPLL